MRGILTLASVTGALVASGGLAAQVPPEQVVPLSIEEAVLTALERSPSAALARLGVAEAETEVAEALAQRRTQLASSASYTRELASADPFAGTDLTGMLGAGAPTDWLLYNERARTDGDPETQPVPLPEFQRRQEEAFRERGIAPPAARDNPFAVDNRFQAGLSVEQPLYDPAAAAGVRGARALRDAAEAAARGEAAAVADTVRRAYLGGLLAEARVDVLARSAGRAQADAQEAAQQVEAGVAPITHRLAAEVEHANLRAELSEVQTESESARDRLALAVGIPQAELVLTDQLGIDDAFATAALDDDELLAEVLAGHATVVEARLALAAIEARADAARAALRPAVNAFADLNYIGNVPDERTRVRTDPLRPFQPEEERRNFFSDDFWNFSADAGVRVSWNVFAGGALRAQRERTMVGIEQARARLLAAESAVVVEARGALRDLRAARDRAGIQAENVQLAEQSYEAVRARVAQGVSTPLERREASTQLDRARLGLLQAVHDYRAARSRLLALAGRIPEAEGTGALP